MRSIHGVGELMTQVVLRGGGFLPTTPTAPPDGEVGKTQTEPEKEDILVMDTKLKIIEILQVMCLHPFNEYVKHLDYILYMKSVLCVQVSNWKRFLISQML